MSHANFMSTVDSFEEVIADITLFLQDKGILKSPAKYTKGNELRYRIQGNTFILKLFDKNNLIETRMASWNLQQLPGCCGVCLSTDARVELAFQAKGIGKCLNKARIRMAQLQGYGSIQCTVLSDNKPQLKILVDNGWECINTFTNPKTKNKINLFVKNLS